MTRDMLWLLARRWYGCMVFPRVCGPRTVGVHCTRVHNPLRRCCPLRAPPHPAHDPRAAPARLGTTIMAYSFYAGTAVVLASLLDIVRGSTTVSPSLACVGDWLTCISASPATPTPPPSPSSPC
jgi:hypothetical protein